jgi:5-methylcytosine-specific restriction endonuclease McrA/transcription elongation factor Elf1
MSENALGKADGSTDNSDKDFSCEYCGKDYSVKASLQKHKRDNHEDSFSVECPSCDRKFESEYGMKIHHKRKHGESIAGELVNCDYCGESFQVLPNRASQDHVYCSNECHGKHRSEIYVGEDHPLYVEKPTFECEYCGKETKSKPSEINKKRFCSIQCKADWQSENNTGENSPTWKGGKVKKDCKICGETVKRKPSHLENQENVFCSYKCHREHQSIHQCGENHHHFEGGRTVEYGPNWKRQRRKALERDNYTCKVCGITEDELEKTIHVHHITPRKKYITNGEIDHERANDLDNLITLCPSCHRKWEGLYLKPDIRNLHECK